MRKYVLYLRVSSAEQGKSGLGLEAQERDIQLFLENYAETPYGVVERFVEVHSGKDNERPLLNAAIALAKREKAVLVVSKLDRLSRRVSFIASLMEEEIGSLNRRILAAHVEQMASMESADIPMILPGLMLVKAADGKNSKLSLMLRDLGTAKVDDIDHNLRKTIILSMNQAGCKWLPGAAPPGHLEDTLLQMLDSLCNENV